MDIRDMKLNVGRIPRSATTRPRRRVLAKPSRPDQPQATADAVAVDSIRWAEFRLAVVGHLIFCDVERGKLRAELKSLSAKKWKHPISGKRVKFSYSTIERWYYFVLKNPEVRLRALPKRRSYAGLPRSLTEQIRHYLVGQAKGHPSWRYSQHYQALLRYMKERKWGPLPGYSTVRRYLLSLPSLQNVPTDEGIKRLDKLVAHLRRTLIVQSTQIKLLRLPELCAKNAGHHFKLSRFSPRDKTHVLSRLDDYRSAGGSRAEFCSGLGVSKPTIERWIASYKRYGESGLCARKRRKLPSVARVKETEARTLEIFHNQPGSYGINRASWTGESLANALYCKHQVKISGTTARRYLRSFGYTMQRSRQVLTSSDPDYREKVEVLLQTLQTLGNDEMLFFIDELGPLAVRKYGGRAFVKKGENLVVPQLQTPKGSIVLAGALSATTNQLTWCYVQSKDTTAMIDLIELLFNEHRKKTKLYITWDAASWHDSISLVDWLDAFNRKTQAMAAWQRDGTARTEPNWGWYQTTEGKRVRAYP